MIYHEIRSGLMAVKIDPIDCEVITVLWRHCIVTYLVNSLKRGFIAACGS